MALTTHSTEYMQNYNSNHHNESTLTKTNESLRLRNIRGNNQVSYTTSTRRVRLRHAFFEQKSHTPFTEKFVQSQVLCEKASRWPDECEPACNLNSLVNEALEEKEPNPVDKKEAELVDTKMGNTFHPKHKFDFEYSFKQYLSQVEWVKRKQLDSYDTKSNIKRRKINTICKEANPNKSVPKLQNFNTETENDELPPKLILFNNRYYRSERKDRITNLKRSESTKVAHEKNVTKVGAENGEELHGIDLKNYFDILDEPVVKKNIKTHKAPKLDAPLNSEFKVVRQNYNNFAFVPVTNNEAKVDKNATLNRLTKINKALFSTFNDAKKNNNKVNVIPITNVKSNIVQNNYSNLNVIPFTKPETVLDLFSVNKVPKSKNVPNANSKGVEANCSDLNAVPVMNSEAITDHFIANNVPENNGASNVNFKGDPVAEKAAMIDMNFQENEMSKSKDTTSINFKVIQLSNDNFTVVPVANNEAKVDKNATLNGVTKINKAPYSTSNDAKMNNNKVNVIPITNVKSNIVQKNYSNLNVVPITKPETVLDLFSVNEVPKSKNVPNVNSKGVAANCRDLNAVPVMNSEAIMDHFIANKVPKNNGASNGNFKGDPVTERAAMVDMNFQENEMLKSKDTTSINFKVIQLSSDNFTVVPVTNNEAKVDKNASLNGLANINKALYCTFNDAKMNNNNVNVIPITKVNSNIVQNNYSNLNVIPITKPETVLNLFSVNEVPKSKNVPNANSKGVEVNCSDLKTVPVMNSEAILDHFMANNVPENNGASNVNFKGDPVTEKAVMVDMNFQGNEMPKSKDAMSINFKVIQVSSDNFTAVPVTNNEAALDHNLVGNEVSKCETAQDVNFKINEETSDSGVFMDHFSVDSEDNIDEANENSLFANRLDDFTFDEFDINLDFLNETKDDFKVNFDQLINMDEHSNANKSTSLDTNQDSKRNCDLVTYSALEEFNSFVNY